MMTASPSAAGTPAKLAGLDHLRAFAIGFVFLFHYRLFQHPSWINDAGSFGWTGVDLFFVLSGYLIASQLFGQLAQGKPLSVGTFYTKRFFRIIPAYLAVLALYYSLPAFREREALPPLWKFLSFTQNFGLDLRLQGCFSHAWSLCIEEQFYLLLPLLLLFSHSNNGRHILYVLAALFALGFAVRTINWLLLRPLAGSDAFAITWYKQMYYPTYNRLDGLLTGVALATLSRFFPAIWARLTRQGNLLLLSGLLLLTGAYILCNDVYSFPASVYGFPLVAIAYGAIVAAAVSTSCILYRMHSAVTSAIANLSYSIYLTHKALIHLTQQAALRLSLAGNSTLLFFLCVGVSLLGALLLRQAVEKPFLRLRGRLLAKPVYHRQG